MTFSCEADFGDQGVLIEVDDGNLDEFLEPLEERLAENCGNFPAASFRYGSVGIVVFDEAKLVELDDDEIEHSRRAVVDVADALGVSGRMTDTTAGGRRGGRHMNQHVGFVSFDVVAHSWREDGSRWTASILRTLANWAEGQLHGDVMGWPFRFQGDDPDWIRALEYNFLNDKFMTFHPDDHGWEVCNSYGATITVHFPFGPFMTQFSSMERDVRDLVLNLDPAPLAVIKSIRAPDIPGSEPISWFNRDAPRLPAPEVEMIVTSAPSEFDLSSFEQATTQQSDAHYFFEQSAMPWSDSLHVFTRTPKMAHLLYPSSARPFYFQSQG